jgi:hypothetical protein
VIVNQPLDVPGWQRLPDPPGVAHDRYFGYGAPRPSAAKSAAREAAHAAEPA